jgi:alpha-tubulin suppressor-like RCC1 family protein
MGSMRALLAGSVVAGVLLFASCSRDYGFFDAGAADASDVTVTSDVGNDATDPTDGTTTDAGDSSVATLTQRTIATNTQFIGASYSCAVVDGGVSCWGADEYGQLGRGGDASTRQPGASDPNPASVAGPDGGFLDQVRGVSLGSTHACALRGDRVLCWGDDGTGQLGNKTQRRYNARPLTVRPAAPLDKVTELVCNGDSCFVTTSTGTVIAWGSNEGFQLTEVADGIDTALPIELQSLAGARTLGMGRYHACAVTSTGEVSCWGLNNFRQTGQAANESCTTTSTFPCTRTPKKVTGLSNIVELAASEDHSCARAASGEVRCWGRASFGQLGVDPTTVTTQCPIGDAGTTPCTEEPRVAFSGAERLAVGGHISCALKAGEVWCWGSDAAGQRGQGVDNETTPFPVAVKVKRTGPVDLTGVVDIAAARTHCCAITQSHEVWCWGEDLEGGIGPGPSHAYVARRVLPP